MHKPLSFRTPAPAPWPIVPASTTASSTTTATGKSSNISSTTSRTSHTSSIVSRLRCVMMLLSAIMAAILVYTMQVTHSSIVHSTDSPPSALSLALKDSFRRKITRSDNNHHDNPIEHATTARSVVQHQDTNTAEMDDMHERRRRQQQRAELIEQAEQHSTTTTTTNNTSNHRGGSGAIADAVAAMKQQHPHEVLAGDKRTRQGVQQQGEDKTLESSLAVKVDEKLGKARTFDPALKHKQEEKEAIRLWNIYMNASGALQDPKLRKEFDPLYIVDKNTPKQDISRINEIYTPTVEYLGVLVDAGRHYYPIEWLQQVIVHLYRLRFNMIHLRLTDDQAFNVKLESYPQLATPVLLKDNANKSVYTPQQLRDLVAFAKNYDVVIVPEINVPGHAGAWAGIPNLILLCPNFICAKGYGLPLNVKHPQLKTILKGILAEIVNIFDNPPFLHLGGDEVNMANPCFEELVMEPFNFTEFEQDLRDVLAQVGYPEEQVIRWERTGEPNDFPRAGKIEHFWESLPQALPDEDVQTDPFFVSTKLYMDTNHIDNARAITRNTWSAMHIQGRPKPIAIVAGGFELGVEFWRQRNVAARLIAVAMGASGQWTKSNSEYVKQYNKTCLGLGIHGNYCDLQGYTAASMEDFLQDHRRMWKLFKWGICDKLTVEEIQLMFRSNTQKRHAIENNAFAYFWDNFGNDAVHRIPSTAEMLTTTSVEASPYHREHNAVGGSSHPRLGKYAVPMAGIIFDCVNTLSPLSQIQSLLTEFLGPLGFNLMQLRLLDDHGIAIRLENLVAFGSAAPEYHTVGEYTKLVKFAAEQFGIQTIPEINLSTQSGGWVDTGYMAKCPKLLCDKGKGMSTDVNIPELMPVIFSILSEVRSIFSTSPYIHLGSDDRIGASHGCLKETQEYHDPMASLALFEEKLTKIVEMVGIQQNQILRWDNGKLENYPDRTGNITHFRAHNPFILPNAKPGENFFASVELLSQSPFKIYERTRALVKLKPQAVLGEIREFGPQMSKTKNIGLRLVAFAMGLRQQEADGDDKDLDKKTFETELIAACKAANFTTCDANPGLNVATTINVETTTYRMNICSQYTYEAIGRVMKPHLQL